MNKKNKARVLSLALIIASTSSFGFITVGTGGVGVCDFDNLADAYNSSIANNDAFIRITTEQTLHDNFNIVTPLFITGGYDDCGDADNNIVGLNLTEWDGDNNSTVVDINVVSVLPLVHFENMRLFNGRNISFAGAGGINVHGDTSLSLVNVEIDNNTGNEGGGIHVFGSNANVTLHNSKISFNNATGAGGGVYCESSAAFSMTGDSSIRANTTDGDGGGVFALGNCQISISSGSLPNFLGSNLGIYGNTAEHGGGVYLKGGADIVLTGDSNRPALIAFNSSTSSSTMFGGGAGVYLTGNGTTLTATNTYIHSNVSSNFAAGIAAYSQAVFNMTRLDAPCWDNDKCSSLSNNIVTGAGGNSGAGIINDNATANISQTLIEDNRADAASVFTIQNNSAVTMEGNLIIHNRGNASVNSQSTFKIGDIFASGGALLDFHYNTISTNNSFIVFDVNASGSQSFIQIFNSIIWEVVDIINVSGANAPSVTVDCNFVNETTTLSSMTTLVDTFITNPNFQDVPNDDYHLATNSFARDLCDETTVQSQFNDLNGKVRGVDDTLLIDFRGPYDAGAYESEDSGDVIFKNGFEN